MPAIRTKAVGLFTTDEDAILARWFGVEPPDGAKAIDVAEAIQRLGFADEPDHYSGLRSLDGSRGPIGLAALRR